MKLKIGIIFGGTSREREVSFAGGRTVYDNLDKSLFEPVPLFVDSFGNFILLHWEHIYKGSIRDFYPPPAALPPMEEGFQIYAESLRPDSAAMLSMAAEIGKWIRPDELPQYIDFAFLTLHGSGGEDGSIQGLLEWYGIPYSGSGILPSALGMDKSVQKHLQQAAGLYVNKFLSVKRRIWLQWNSEEKKQWYKKAVEWLGKDLVVKPANQGSSLGVSVLKEPAFEAFEEAIRLAFFQYKVKADEWQALSQELRVIKVKQWTDIRSGLGLPLKLNGEIIYRPDALLHALNDLTGAGQDLWLEALDTESTVVIEQFIEGKEFSCIVVANEDGSPLALPPTEIRKNQDLFDYRSKYLPGLSRKVTPIEIPDEHIRNIRGACAALYKFFQFHVYARIDGFVTSAGEVFLNDPNTTSGMMPSSFFFHQAAEIGLNSSQFLTYIIRRSLIERMDHSTKPEKSALLLQVLDALMEDRNSQQNKKRKIAVIMGGYSFERHISMESGRNIYEKLSSSEEFEPIPVFLTGSKESYELYLMPFNIMLKDNADDVRNKVTHYTSHPLLKEIALEAQPITQKFNPEGALFEPKKTTIKELSEWVEGAFIALHGRPGEDGTLQKDLIKHGIYFNGSGVESSSVTINKYETNERLAAAGFKVAQHVLVKKDSFLHDASTLFNELKIKLGLPFIVKPVDDGCSAAVKKIKNESEFFAFGETIFRPNVELPLSAEKILGVKPSDEFPQKIEFLAERFIDKGDAAIFLEITGGMLTHILPDGTLSYEVFEPSETLAEYGILSLEEKFLAGQGQNITPARFSSNSAENKRISQEVRKTLEAVARTLNVVGYCRIDAFVKVLHDGTIETSIIEINSLPGMTPATCIYHQAAINQYKPYDFIREILLFGQLTLPTHA